MATSALTVDITPLKRKPGTQHHFELSFPPPEGVVLETAEVRATQLHLDLKLEGAGEELIAFGQILVDWTVSPLPRRPRRHDHHHASRGLSGTSRGRRDLSVGGERGRSGTNGA